MGKLTVNGNFQKIFSHNQMVTAMSPVTATPKKSSNQLSGTSGPPRPKWPLMAHVEAWAMANWLDTGCIPPKNVAGVTIKHSYVGIILKIPVSWKSGNLSQ